MFADNVGIVVCMCILKDFIRFLLISRVGWRLGITVHTKPIDSVRTIFCLRDHFR